MAKNTTCFLEIGGKIQKKFCSLKKDFFSKCSNVHFDCSLDTPAKKFLPYIHNELKKNKENSTKRLIFFTQIFCLVYCKLAVECKRKEILLEYLRKCGKMHFKKTNFDKIALNWFFKTFFLHVFKVCEKEVFHFRKLKDVKNCLFAKTYAPLFQEIILNRIWLLKKTVAAG